MRKFAGHMERIAIERKLLNKIMPTSKNFRYHINRKFTSPEDHLAPWLITKVSRCIWCSKRCENMRWETCDFLFRRIADIQELVIELSGTLYFRNLAGEHSHSYFWPIFITSTADRNNVRPEILKFSLNYVREEKSCVPGAHTIDNLQNCFYRIIYCCGISCLWCIPHEKLSFPHKVWEWGAFNCSHLHPVWGWSTLVYLLSCGRFLLNALRKLYCCQNSRICLSLGSISFPLLGF